MKQEDFLKLMDTQEEKNVSSLMKNYREVIESEFVLSNVVLRHLDFIEKSNDSQNYVWDIQKLIAQSGPLTKKLKDFDISKHMKGQAMYLHKHTYIELDYVYQGECTYYIENEARQFQLKEKEICVINQNVVHGIEVKDEHTIIIKCMIPFEYIEIEQFVEIPKKIEMINFLTSATLENTTKPYYMVFHITDAQRMEENMYEMFQEFLNKEIGWRNAIKNHLSNLFLYLMRREKTDLVYVKELKEENFNITKLVECIRRNYQCITLKDLAKDFHFHENYLSRMIKTQCKVNFRELLCQIRLKEAEKLLMSSELSVTEIAEQIGYSKPTFFFKLFKERYGTTPMEYRKKYQKK